MSAGAAGGWQAPACDTSAAGQGQPGGFSGGGGGCGGMPQPQQPHAPILCETGREGFVECAISDGTSYACPRCGDVVLASRRAQHEAFWCSAGGAGGGDGEGGGAGAEADMEEG
ncbi:hypothetical protein HYH03_008345 [Edaphochlamys debaryana]|uniref:C2HC zinc finger plants domain-containing protein n=1 Tax=Edaphochlamys debaryana TaxID=47281 RepID=A0A835Y0B2_9CHLO|nr:hypothetical protein HYH03_008345 [Edaphochlamys debaryana]|eukprot:KAG2493531.1 hypothetical protein HYH03_008345 [Edaphochlamys debaryana]